MKRFFGAIVLSFWAATAWALPESMLNTRLGGVIPKMIDDSKGDLGQLRAALSKTGVQVLDDLWDARRDVVQGACDQRQNDCRVLSVLPGKNSDNPMVLLPGFTGFRKTFLEEAYDLIQAGYGPIYIMDFEGTGESFKPELAAGQPEPTIAEVSRKYPKAGVLFSSRVTQLVGPDKAAGVLALLNQIPLGIGYIPDMNDYEQDIDFVMSTAIAHNPDRKIHITTLSMSGLSLLLALNHQQSHPTWVTHVGRIVLESPMTRLRETDSLHGGFFAQILSPLAALFRGPTTLVNPEGGISQFVDKSLGNYNPGNTITHSPNRITMGDATRLWNFHETAGSTYGWVFQVLSHQYSLSTFDHFSLEESRLNTKIDQIRQVLNDNGIVLSMVASLADPLVDTRATQALAKDLATGSTTDVNLCLFQTARHQVDYESDRYRDPFMELLFDQKDHLVKPVYGVEPQNELLRCRKAD